MLSDYWNVNNFKLVTQSQFGQLYRLIKTKLNKLLSVAEH